MTPNLRYINQSAPFWDWIASFEQSAAEHPFFGGAPAHTPGEERGPASGGPAAAGGPWGAWANPWARSFSNWHGGDLPHRGGPPPNHHHGPPSHPHGPPHGPPPHYQDGPNASGEEYSSDEKAAAKEEEAAKDGAVADPPEETPERSDRETRRCARRDRRQERHASRHARREGRERGGWGPFGGGPHSHHHHQHPYGGRGGWGGGMPGRGGFRMLSELFGPGGPQNETNDADWKPEADAFDTEGSYVVHVSLPGAHKEDIGVTWDAEKSELSVSGVVHRPGDEAFLKTLALDERKTGAFERKIRLGTRAVPAHVDVEGISAKLENGILIVDVPKLNGEFVEVKKVDIE